MKKLLFTISQLYKGGAETALVNLLNQLDYSKYEVELLILNQCPVDGAVSLVERINYHITICDAYQEYKKVNFFDRVRAKCFYTIEQKGAYYFPALDFVRNKIYDWAFFVGEWCSPSFVAYEVQAKIKAAWIHNDLSEAEYFNEEHYFYFADMYDYFIFVSQNSKKASIEKYPFLKDKSVCIYNINDVANIKKRAEETVDLDTNNKFTLLTCANFRTQKNHLRQVKVISELKKRNLDVIWINIGATTDKDLVERVKDLCEIENVKNEFLILGSKENPYSYIKKADAVTVLSDYESWSMVITEAKILGVPVIATKTSGALEQIEHEKTGILTEFEINDIVNKIEKFIKDKMLRENIKNNISNFDNTKDILNSFDELIFIGEPYKKRSVVSKKEERILYFIDNINYVGGAHIATKLQISKFLKQEKNISIFSNNIPDIQIRNELPEVRFLSWKDFREDLIYNERFISCLANKTLTNKEKKLKISQVIATKLLKKIDYYEKRILPTLSNLISNYDIACVMSEGSSFRNAVANSSCKKKIQWIHIDYCNWKDRSDWNRYITKDDADLYKKYDVIVLLSENIKNKFCNLYPHLKEKVIVNKNLIPVDEIKKKANVVLYKNKIPVKFVTVGRIDYQKAYPRLITILGKLKEQGFNFRWSLIGGGEKEEEIKIKDLIIKNGLDEWVTMMGNLKNPFIEMKKADVFALFSEFEGIPNTIYEALVLGIPVAATDIGGICTQIENNITGWLVENNEKSIEKIIQYIILNPYEIERIKENIKNYQYDNKKVIEINNLIFKI